MKANFHTHTYRCGHAAGHEREYIECAVKAGFDTLGFSDHTPWPHIGELAPGVGMDISELEGYVKSLRALREEYAGRIDLKIGLECEYFRRFKGWLKDAVEALELDYIILGNHFEGIDTMGPYFGMVTDREGAMSYLRLTCEGMETGMYAYLAHPELFLRAYPVWDAAAKDVCRQLCRTANAVGIPVEYNLEGVRANRRGNHPGLGYPYIGFWEIAAEEGCTAIIGYDAHQPELLTDDSDEQAAKELIDVRLGMKRIETIF